MSLRKRLAASPAQATRSASRCNGAYASPRRPARSRSEPATRRRLPGSACDRRQSASDMLRLEDLQAPLALVDFLAHLLQHFRHLVEVRLLLAPTLLELVRRLTSPDRAIDRSVDRALDRNQVGIVLLDTADQLLQTVNGDSNFCHT